MYKSKGLFVNFKQYYNCVSTLSNIKCKFCTLETSNIELKCWKCSKNISTKNIFCNYCNTIQKPNNNNQHNYYDLFNLKIKYLLDNKELSKKFKSLQNQLHPDKFSNKDKEEQSISESYSSFINKAYSVLQSPLERGVYLLSLENITIDEASKGTDQKLLMHVLMLNEQMDDADTEEEVTKLQKHIRTILDELILQINECFEKKNLDEAKEFLIRMKYYTTLESKIREKKNQLELERHSK